MPEISSYCTSTQNKNWSSTKIKQGKTLLKYSKGVIFSFTSIMEAFMSANKFLSRLRAIQKILHFVFFVFFSLLISLDCSIVQSLMLPRGPVASWSLAVLQSSMCAWGSTRQHSCISFLQLPEILDTGGKKKGEKKKQKKPLCMC